MKIIGKNVVMTRGDSETLTVRRFDKDGNVPFEPGDELTLTLRETVTSPTVSLSKTVTEFTDGKAIFAFAPADTRGLSFRTYVYDIQLTESDDTVTTIVTASNWNITAEVTVYNE
jgi:hypothetical protein